MNEFDLAYAAGVIDSDGWITIARSNSSYRLLMELSQATPEACNLMKELNHRAAAETEREGLNPEEDQVSDSPTYRDGKPVEVDGDDLLA